MKTILVPTDFSDASKHSLDFATQIAKKENAKITLVHAIEVVQFYEDFYSGISTMVNYMDEIQDVSKDKLKKLSDEILDESIQIETKVMAGKLPHVLDELIREEDVDLIVMGTNGSSGLSEIFIGSNTEKIVRQAKCPVICIPNSATIQEIKKILIPLDLSEIRKTFLDNVSKMQKIFNAELNFIWVQTPHNVENNENIKEELSNLLVASGFEKSTFKVSIIKSIFPSDGILLASDQYNANLIAMATHGRRGLAHWMHGSLTEDTVNHSNKPIWTFKINNDEKPINIKSIKVLGRKPQYLNFD